MQLLLVDDDAGFLNATSKLLGILEHNVSTANSVSTAKLLISSQPDRFDQLLIDLMLEDGSGLELLDVAMEHCPKARITIITGNPAVKSLVKSLYGPKIDYLIKPISLDDLKGLLDRDQESEDNFGEGDSSEHSESAGNDLLNFGGLIGESASMQTLYEQIARVSKTRANVMLFGESGVGKEVVANAIHFVSKAKGELVPINCGALSKDLIGSELFGHEKGAFTGAVARKEGIFEQGNRGTVFLDEVTEMPIDMQPNLLRVLETKQVKRLGGTKLIDFDARVISATNRDQDEVMDNGKVMREDLFYRLAIFPIHIPTLRERKEDIPALANYFLSQLNVDNGTNMTFSEEGLEILGSHDWPGNVRELRHSVHRAYIMTPEESETVRIDNIDDISLLKQSGKSANQAGMIKPGRTIAEVERELIEATMKSLQGDKKRAADSLGISLKTLYSRLSDYGQEA